MEDKKDEEELQADVDRLYKKLSVEKHEKLQNDMRYLVTRFRLRSEKYETKVGYSTLNVAGFFYKHLESLPALLKYYMPFVHILFQLYL